MCYNCCLNIIKIIKICLREDEEEYEEEVYREYVEESGEYRFAQSGQSPRYQLELKSFSNDKFNANNTIIYIGDKNNLSNARLRKNDEGEDEFIII